MAKMMCWVQTPCHYLFIINIVKNEVYDIRYIIITIFTSNTYLFVPIKYDSTANINKRPVAANSCSVTISNQGILFMVNVTVIHFPFSYNISNTVLLFAYTSG